MKGFKGLVLCDYHSGRVDVHVRADIRYGALTISGHDLGPYVEGSWGDEDYEYWYKLDRKNTEKLLDVIHGSGDPKSALLREFSGEGGCRALVKICEENEIKYSFQSYV